MKPSMSPMLAQYMDIKDKHPGCLLFFRMGDFYELFFEDARDAAAALDIALTKRNKAGDDDIPMCGVPVHSHESYLERLIRQGFKVAICEQIESPEEARKRPGKTLVKRDVVRIVTPGTVTEDRLLDARQSNLLMAISIGDQELGLACADISTGTFVTEQISQLQLPSALSRLMPAEVVMPDIAADIVPVEEMLQGQEGLVVSHGPAQHFDEAQAKATLKRVCGVQHLEGAGDLLDLEWRAAGGLAGYLEKTQKQAIGHFPLPTSQRQLRVLSMDLATRRSLELLRTQSGERKGSLLWAIDRTLTGPGGRKLAAWLAGPLMDCAAIHHRQERVRGLVEASNIRFDIRERLRRCPDMERALGRLSADRAGPRDYGAIRDGLEASRMLMADIEPVEPLTSLFSPLDFPAHLFQTLHDLLVDELPVQDKDGGVIREGANAELDSLRKDATGGRQRIAELQARYQDETGISGLRIKHNNLIGYFIEVQVQHRDHVPAHFVQRQSMANATRYHTEELLELAQRLENAGDQARMLERNLVQQLRHAILEESAVVRSFANSTAALDVTAALAELAVTEGYMQPTIDDTSGFVIEGGRHPVVEQMLRRDNESFMANDCDLSEGGRLWLLTGPNMAGKSTYLRQNALIAIMAQIGSYVPVQSARIGLIDRVFSRVGAADDLARGRSTFMVEMTETAAILNTATPRSLVILDEIGRGTATFDGLSLAWAVVEFLHDQLRCRGLFATHYHELTQLAERLPQLSCSRMMVKEWRGDIRFLHQVAPGAADRSYGIHVARLAGLPQAVLKRAALVLKQLEESETMGASSTLAKEMPLFDMTDDAPHEETDEGQGLDAAQIALLEALDTLDPDAMTPRLALEAVYRLKAIREGGEE